MTLPLYIITLDGDMFQVCLYFKGETYPIPGKRYTSYYVANMVIKQMKAEDYKHWQESSLAKQSREYDGEGKPL
jgi:hypothetical protein